MSSSWNRNSTADPITRAHTTSTSSDRELQPPLPPPRAQSLSCRQLLQQRLQKHQWQPTFSVDCSGPQHAQKWKFSCFLGDTMIGESDRFTNKDAAKENAAMQALAWLDGHYPQFASSSTAVQLSNNKVQTPPPPPRPPSEVQPSSSRELLNERLQKYKWKANFCEDCGGPQHAPLWKVSFFLGDTMIGASTWLGSKDAAKENAAEKALSWLNTNGYP